MSNPDITLTLNSRGPPTSHGSEHSPDLTDEDSSGTGVHLSDSHSPSSAVGSQDFSDKEYTDSAEDYENDTSSWTQLSKHDVGPSESASRPGTSNHHRFVQEAPRPSRREASHIRLPHRPLRNHHLSQPLHPESVDPNEELLAYGPDLSRQRRPYQWGPYAGGQGHRYPQNYTNPGYNSYTSSSVVPSGQQIVPFATPPGQYAYPPYQQGALQHAPGYFGHGHHAAPPPITHPSQTPGMAPFSSPDLMHGNMQGYFPFPPSHGYPIPHQIAPSPVYHAYPPVYAPSTVNKTPPPPPPPPDTSKDEAYAELKRIMMEERAEREGREIAARMAEEAKIAKAEADKKWAEEIAAAAAAAAAAATNEAEKKAAEKAAEEAGKAKVEAEEAKAKAEAESAKLKAEAEEAKAKSEADAAKLKTDAEAAATAAAAAATAAAAAAPPPPPEEKKKPIKFKDAVGRKFSFPFHLCNTWEGMEDLIRQAFLHVDIIGPHVVEGHYDLLGPNNEIILPRVWETVVEPDWTITMHMWPMPEPPKPEDAPVIEVPEVSVAPVIEELKPKSKKKPARAAYTGWFAGSRPKRPGKGAKKGAVPPPPPPPPPPAAG